MRNNRIKLAKADIIMLGVIGALILLHCILMLVPFIWSVTESFNDYYSYIINPFSFPKPKSFNDLFANYSVAFKKLNITVNSPSRGKVQFNIFNMSVYSFIIAFGITFMQTLVSSVNGYVISKYKHWRVSRIIANVNIFLLVFTTVGSLPASLQLYKAIGMYNNLIPFILLGHYGAGMHMIMFSGAFSALPNDYKEAATIDGAGHYTVMFRIYYPMVIPLWASVFLLGFIGHWNDYMLCVMYLPSYPNLAYGMYMFQTLATSYGYSVPEILAGCIIVAIPTAILWISTQKLITSKLTVGGLKG